jgi:hypothetical protein
MLKLDQFSESVLFQCDRCQQVGELFTDIIEEDGSYHCWYCLNEMKRSGEKIKEEKETNAING